MSSMSKVITRIRRSIRARRKTYSNRLRARYKIIRKSYKKLGNPAHYIWIMGCQRSGTTHLERIFRSDLNSEVFGEFSELSISPEVTVWKPLPEIDETLSFCNARYAVARPLFESDRAHEIMEFFPRSSTVWLYRDYYDVVDSMINKWGDKFFKISQKCESDENGSWRFGTVLQQIEKEAGLDATIQDKYALYWLIRNEIIFSDTLVMNPRLLCLNYKQLVTNPKYCIDVIMKRSGLTTVWRGFKTDSHTKSLNKNISFSISPELSGRCQAMLTRLQQLSKDHFPEA
jgi:hypothetical protein